MVALKRRLWRALADALTSAYTGQPQLQSIRQDLEKSKAALTGAITGFLPSLTLAFQTEHYVSSLPGSAPIVIGSTTVGGYGSQSFTTYPTLGCKRPPTTVWTSC